jgi:hypothetical protein
VPPEQNSPHTTILIKRRVSGDPGSPEHLAPGELAFNEVSKILYIGIQSASLSAE